MTTLGPMAAAQLAVAHTLAHVPGFQAWVGAANALEARLRIYEDALPDPDAPQETRSRAAWEALRPYALIWTAEENGFSDSRIAHRTYAAAGSIAIRLTKTVPGPLVAKKKQADRVFRDEVDLILTGLREIAGTSDFFAYDTLTVDGPGWNSVDDEPTEGVCQAYDLLLTYDEGGSG